jgi:hypothetical protein
MNTVTNIVAEDCFCVPDVAIFDFDLQVLVSIARAHSIRLLSIALTLHH